VVKPPLELRLKELASLNPDPSVPIAEVLNITAPKLSMNAV
jgi:hypothetical protein